MVCSTSIWCVFAGVPGGPVCVPGSVVNPDLVGSGTFFPDPELFVSDPELLSRIWNYLFRILQE